LSVPVLCITCLIVTLPNKTVLLSANTGIWLKQVSHFLLSHLSLYAIGMRRFLQHAIL
jgi:hypothetical protein